jgi:copper(I)-binding protein
VNAGGRRRGGGLLGVLAAAILIAVLLGHNGKAAPKSVAGTAGGKVGDLTVTDVYAPAQTTPDLASVYLTVTDGGAADVLEAVTSDRAGTVQVMSEHASGGSTSEMTQEPTLDIPAHQTVSLIPGRGHLMLVNPPALLKQGQQLSVTLRFERNGVLTLQVPVTGLAGPSS